MTTGLRDALVEVSESMPSARLTPDVWRRGRQARRRGLLVRAALVAVVVGVAAFLLPWSLTRALHQQAADGGAAVPATLSLPWMWQATVQMDPPGEASVLFGGDTIGLRGIDLFDSEGKIAVMGRGGDYRMLLYAGFDSVAAGEDVLLSPDGTRVAQQFLVGSGFDDNGGMVVVDLATGKSTQYRGGQPGCCAPVAWAPDGASMVATILGDSMVTDPETGIMMAPHRLVLLDLRTDTIIPLGEFRPAQDVRTASRAAFSPDGKRIAVTEGTTLRLMDLRGSTLWSVDLGERRYLAGVGAFSADGTRIATVALDGCLDECDERALAERSWSVGYLDAATGRPVPGASFATVTGMAVRALGWSNGRDLVVLRYLPEAGAHKTRSQRWNDTGWYETGHITLLALAPDGSTRTLLDPPDGVLTMDVARDLLEAGRFGGPSSSASIFPARGIIWVMAPPLACLVAVAAVVTMIIVRIVRGRRRRA
jgi:hypothetical protein